jgi:hypothetical protein
MNRTVISAIGFALAGVAAIGSAQAQTINDGGSGDGDLFLIVEDTSTGTSYVQDMGIQTSQIGSASAINTAVSGATPGTVSNALSFNYSQDLDATLTAQLSGHPTDSYTWEVIATSTAPTNTYLVSTSNAAITSPFNSGVYSNNSVRSNQSNLTGDIDGWTGLATTFANEPAGYNPSSASFIPFSSQTGQPGTATNTGVLSWYGTGGITPINGLTVNGSSAASFYLVSANDAGSNSPGVASIFNLGTATLNDSAGVDKIIFSGSPTVPLPAAFWLLGSGLVGLAGVARRRRLAAT